MGLKRRLALGFVLLAVLPLTAAGILLTWAAYNTAYDLKLVEQRQTAANAASQVDAQVASMVRELMLVVRVRGLSSLTGPQRQAILAELMAWDHQIADLAWLDPDGIVLTRVSSGTSAVEESPENATDLRELVPNNGTVHFGAVHMDSETAEPTMMVAVPETKSRTGAVNGTLVARLRLKRMSDVTATSEAGDQLLYIADPNGQVIAHPDVRLVLQETTAKLPKNDGMTAGLDGEPVLAARAELIAGSQKLVVVAQQPLGKALALPFQTALTTLATVAGALAAALALALLANRSIIGPIQRLAEVAGRISAGDLSRRATGYNSNDEIGELAQAFNAMTARLVEAVASLEARVASRTRDLTATQARLTDAIESISEGFVLCDAEDRIVLANGRFRDFYPEIAHLAQDGRPFRELLIAAHRLGLATDGEPRDAWLIERQRLRTEQRPHIQHLTNGRWLLINERSTSSGQMVAIYTDITDLKAGEEELRQAKAQAETATQVKSDFLAAMSHELRTPLNAIIGFSDAMRHGVFGEMENPRYRDYVNDIFLSGTHLLSLINDILDLSKIEAGAMKIEMTPVHMNEVVKRALVMTRDSAVAHGLKLEVFLPSDLPAIMGDARRLMQVVLNLLSNAVKFTPEGGSVVVSAGVDTNHLILRVTDTGIGIAAADIPLAQEAFGQVESSRSRRFPGSGLGLPLSRKLVELHGGTVSIDSTVGVGTVVTLRLPLSPPQTPMMASPSFF